MIGTSQNVALHDDATGGSSGRRIARRSPPESRARLVGSNGTSDRAGGACWPDNNAGSKPDLDGRFPEHLALRCLNVPKITVFLRGRAV